MANQYVNKVEYGNDTLIDLTGDNVTAGDVKSGVRFHLPSGAQGTGSLQAAYVTGKVLVLPNSTVSGTTVNVGE